MRNGERGMRNDQTEPRAETRTVAGSGQEPEKASRAEGRREMKGYVEGGKAAPSNASIR